MNGAGTHENHRCPEFLEQLSRYLDNDLADVDRASIEQHLRDCPCCEELLEGLKHTVALCHDEGRPDLPEAFRLRAKARIAALLAGKAKRAARRRTAG